MVKPIGADDADTNVFTILVCFYRGTRQLQLTPQLSQPRNVIGHNMKQITIIITISIISFLGCKNHSRPMIQMNSLKTDWIIKDSVCLFIEDSLLMTDLFEYQDIYTYKFHIKNDSIMIKAVYPYNINRKFEAVFRINELTKNRLRIEFIKGTKGFFYTQPNKKFNFVRDSIRKNDKLIKQLEFSSTMCLGRCTALDLKISEDSILYIRGYAYVKYQGFYKHRLTSKEFDRINEKFNRIDLNSFYSKLSPPDASSFSFNIITDDSMIYKCNGLSNQDLYYFTRYLINLERLLEFSKADTNCFRIENDFNRKWYRN